MDVVYILGSGSVWDNNEIRFSLRSVFKNVLDLGKVFIFGERPDWLQNVSHHFYPDPYPLKWRNAYYKISAACNYFDVSDDFLLMNDDFFIVKPIYAKDYPYYYSVPLGSRNALLSSKFRTTLKETGRHLLKYKRPFLSFSVHRPIRYNKKSFLNMPIPVDSFRGFSPRSFYCNYYGVRGIKCKDPLLSPLMKEKDFDHLTSDLTDFSIFSSTARSAVFHNWIKKKFPFASPFEKI